MIEDTDCTCNLEPDFSTLGDHPLEIIDAECEPVATATTPHYANLIVGALNAYVSADLKVCLKHSEQRRLEEAVTALVREAKRAAQAMSDRTTQRVTEFCVSPRVDWERLAADLREAANRAHSVLGLGEEGT